MEISVGSRKFNAWHLVPLVSGCLWLANNFMLLHGSAYGTLPSQQGLVLRVHDFESRTDSYKRVGRNVWLYSLISDAIANMMIPIVMDS